MPEWMSKRWKWIVGAGVVLFMLVVMLAIWLGQASKKLVPSNTDSLAVFNSEHQQLVEMLSDQNFREASYLDEATTFEIVRRESSRRHEALTIKLHQKFWLVRRTGSPIGWYTLFTSDPLRPASPQPSPRGAWRIGMLDSDGKPLPIASLDGDLSKLVLINVGEMRPISSLIGFGNDRLLDPSTVKIGVEPTDSRTVVVTADSFPVSIQFQHSGDAWILDGQPQITK